MGDDILGPVEDQARFDSRERRELLEAGGVFLWVHAGSDQPQDSIALVEAIRSLGASVPGWCPRLQADADRLLEDLEDSRERRHEATLDASTLFSIASLLRRAAERIAAAADVLSPASGSTQ